MAHPIRRLQEVARPAERLAELASRPDQRLAQRAALGAGSRDAGPCKPRIATSSPPAPRTGAASAFEVGLALAHRLGDPGRADALELLGQRAESVIVRSVNAISSLAGPAAPRARTPA